MNPGKSEQFTPSQEDTDMTKQTTTRREWFTCDECDEEFAWLVLVDLEEQCFYPIGTPRCPFHSARG